MLIWERIRLWTSKLLNLDTEIADPLQRSKIRFLYSALVIGFLILFFNQIMDLLSGRAYITGLAVVLLDLPLLVAIGMVRFRMYNGAKFLFLGVFTAAMMSGHLWASFIGSENFLFVVVLIGFSVLNRRISMAILTLYCALLYLLIRYGMNSGFLQQGDLPEYYQYVNSFFAFVLVALLTYRYSSLNDRQVRILDEINQDLQKKRALSEKLMRELNHRVKNNLQIISSLFNLQAHSTENRETKMALGEARNRINSIAILHQKLYQGELLFEVEIQSYLQSLCEYMHMSDASPQTMEIHVNVAPYILSIQDTIYLGLVVNELVTNSLKYARQDGKHLRIQVVLESADGLLHLTVKDNGQGFAVSEKEIRKGFGLELVETIADHYDGKLSAGVVVGGGYQTSLALQMENRGFSSSRR